MFYTLETLYHKKINKIWILFISWVIPLTYKNIKSLPQIFTQRKRFRSNVGPAIPHNSDLLLKLS